jgi:hypothetical protein
MLELMDTPNRPEFAHPIYWAPFVVVGEGGSAIGGGDSTKIPISPTMIH